MPERSTHVSDAVVGLLCGEELASVCWHETGSVAYNALFVCFNISLYPFVKCGRMVPRVKVYVDGLLQMWVGEGWGQRRTGGCGHGPRFPPVASFHCCNTHQKCTESQVLIHGRRGHFPEFDTLCSLLERLGNHHQPLLKGRPVLSRASFQAPVCWGEGHLSEFQSCFQHHVMGNGEDFN